MGRRHDTRYYRIEELFNNSQVGDTPDCIYLTLPTDEV